MTYRFSSGNKEAFKVNVFKLFTDAVGGDLEIFTDHVYERHTVDDFAYHEAVAYLAVESYFQKVVVPHKIAVYNAGVNLIEQEWFKDLHINALDFKENLFFHDISKFCAEEAFGYATHNFNNPGASKNIGFEKAWHHHKMHNEHHPEYWMNPNRGGELEILPMDRIYIVEMIADWIGAGVTYGNSLEKWLPDNIHKFIFHPGTAAEVAWILNKMGLPFKKIIALDDQVIIPIIPVLK